MLELVTERKNWPIIRTTVMVGSPLLVVLLIQGYYFKVPLILNFHAVIWFLISLTYVHFFEYFHHRWPMHGRIIVSKFNIAGLDDGVVVLNKILKGVRQSHKTHHRIFSITDTSDNLQSTNIEDLKHITGPWWFFPTAFFVHYLLLLLLVHFSLLTVNNLTFFAAGTVVHYLIYEIPHFLAHSKNNKIDGLIFRTPILGNWRQKWIDYHLDGHHRKPQTNFSVTGPWLDPIFGTRSPKNPTV